MANEPRTFGTQLNGERRAFAPLHIQNRRQQDARPLKPTQGPTANTNADFLQGQENRDIFNHGQFDAKRKGSFTIYTDEGVFSQETIKPKSLSDSFLDDKIVAMEKNLNSFLIDSLEKNSSEICDKENRSISCVEDSEMVALDSKENSVADDSVLDQSEVSYIQQHTDFDRLAEYADTILPYMLEKERKYMANPFYMNNQPNINSRMRSILVDWLVDVADEYNIKDETLYLAINYIDRFLSKVSITRQEFQLLGTAALFIATKYEEIYPPEIGEFVYITDDSFNKLQILQMEKLILTVLEFDVSTPTANYFLENYVAELALDKEVYCLSKYLCFLSLLECTPFLKYYPSEIALCSILVASQILGFAIPEHFMRKTFDYEQSLGKNGDANHFANDRAALMDEMRKLHAFAADHQQQAIQRKFSTSKYFKVAKYTSESCK